MTTTSYKPDEMSSSILYLRCLRFSIPRRYRFHLIIRRWVTFCRFCKSFRDCVSEVPPMWWNLHHLKFFATNYKMFNILAKLHNFWKIGYKKSFWLQESCNRWTPALVLNVWGAESRSGCLCCSWRRRGPRHRLPTRHLRHSRCSVTNWRSPVFGNLCST